MKSLKKSKKAFTLIEILISLIIIGIVAVTLPIMLQTSTKTIKTSAKEEVFYQEFSLLQLINSLYFDENNTKDDNYYKDLNATGGDSELLIHKYNTNYNRIGKEEFNNNILRSGTSYTVSPIKVDAGEINGSDATYDDIDDYNGFSEKLLSYGEVTLHVSVKYIKDDANYSSNKINFNFDYKTPANFTNIKLITVYTTLDSKKISISYPAMNIGESKYLSLEEITK